MKASRVRPSLVNFYSKCVSITIFILGVIYYYKFNAKSIAFLSTTLSVMVLVVTPRLLIFNEYISILFLCICSLFEIFFTVSQTGGILSPVLLWITATPTLVGLIFKNRNYIIWSGIFSILVPIFIFYFDFETIFSQDEVRVAALFALTGIGVLNTLLIFAFHRELENEKSVIKDQMEKLKSMEGELVQSEKMATIGLLASGIAHQLGNTLNVISGNTILINSLIKKDVIPVDKIKIRIGELFESIELSKQIIGSLNSASKNNEVYSDHHLFGIVESSILLSKGKSLERVSIENKVEKDFTVKCVKGSLIQILMNLISNSIDSITSSFGKIEIQSQVGDQTIKLFVKDNGQGIPIEVQERMFDPFITSKQGNQGTGLGLYLIKKEVEKMNGSISFTTGPQGTTFVIEIPRIEITKNVG